MSDNEFSLKEMMTRIGGEIVTAVRAYVDQSRTLYFCSGHGQIGSDMANLPDPPDTEEIRRNRAEYDKRNSEHCTPRHQSDMVAPDGDEGGG